MGKTSIQYIKAAASKLRDSKLQRLGGKEITAHLDGVASTLGLGCKGEALIFTALFDRSCAGRSSDLDDIAHYFGCPQLEVMEYVPSLKSLMEKGLVVQTDLSECRIGRQNFMVSNYVIGCVLENRKPECRQARILEKSFDKYDFCKLVDSMVQDSDVTAEALFQQVETMERDNQDMPMVKELVAVIRELPARALFYEVAYDFFTGDGHERSDLARTLRDIYESVGVRLSERKALLEGSHPLVKADLLELSGDKEDILLSLHGQRLFLGEDFGAFGKHYIGLDRYSFAREVKEFVHSKDHDTANPLAMKRLAEKMRLIEDSNSALLCVGKVREIVHEEDIRALFYIVCNACAEGEAGANVLGELGKLYPVKERNSNLKLFKEEAHKLQRLDLVEMVSMNGFLGEYTVLRLTDRGKELYFEEDASIFIEKICKKELIEASSIKEKRLFFSQREQEQLSMVENALLEENYRSLVERLDAKGLPRGIAILLYGAPGTGKTESVMQWARVSGRDIIHVDISAAKSMWYGESEKIVKGIFTRYRQACKRAAVKPILLFNEADAIFSKRRDMDSGRSIDQTENTIQNIILEEMERLDGILIATTNLAGNLDAAFERRFLFKIRFDRPSVEAKRKIWLDKLPWLGEQAAGRLAESYNFSGGEIDNIVRKATMMEVLDGTAPSVEAIDRLCAGEKIARNQQGAPRIGFR